MARDLIKKSLSNDPTDITKLEKEINDTYKSNPNIYLQDLQIFAKINEYAYQPIDFSINNGYISIGDNDTILGKDIYIGSKRQYITETVVIPSSSNSYTLSTKFATAWNENKYLFFKNGLYIGRNRYHMIIPEFDNTYKYKKVIFDFDLTARSQLDIVYVECDDGFDDIHYNKDLRIYSKEVFAGSYIEGLNSFYIQEYTLSYFHFKSFEEAMKNGYDYYLENYYIGPKRIIKIPYPYDDYPRNPHTFYVFNSNTEHLRQGIDYIVSKDLRYIILEKKFRLGEIEDDTFDPDKFVSFIFPYTKEDWEEPDSNVGNNNYYGANSGITYKYSYSVSADNSTGTITFDPKFLDYTLTKDDFILMADTVWIEPDRFDIINNWTIQMKPFHNRLELDETTMTIYDTGQTDQNIVENTFYTMIIFAENNLVNREYKKYHFEIYDVEVETDGQTRFYCPLHSDVIDFLVFRGTTLMEQDTRYTYDPIREYITLLYPTSTTDSNDNDLLKKGSKLTFVYLRNDSKISSTAIKINKIQYELEKDGSFILSSAMYENLVYDYSNLLLFMNGLYLEPDRYTITTGSNINGAKIEFNDSLQPQSGTQFDPTQYSQPYSVKLSPTYVDYRLFPYSYVDDTVNGTKTELTTYDMLKGKQITGILLEVIPTDENTSSSNNKNYAFLHEKDRNFVWYEEQYSSVEIEEYTSLDSEGNTITNTYHIVKVPYPFYQYYDTKFFICDENGSFISEKYYEFYKDKNEYIKFKDDLYDDIKLDTPDGIERIRFIFCHKFNEYSILKKEINITCQKDVLTYSVDDSPYSDLVNLEYRCRVFFKRKMIYHEQGDYYFTNITKKITLRKETEVNDGDELVLVFFYVGRNNTHTIAELPQSGYIYLEKECVDRNYNKNLMAVFINGKLISKDQILDLTNNIHKINTDIKSRYDLQVVGMSPKIKDIIPFYKRLYEEKRYARCLRRHLDLSPVIYKSTFIFASINVPGNTHKRHYIEEIAEALIPKDIIEKHQDAYITLMHHHSINKERKYLEGEESPLNYSLTFYDDDYTEVPSEIQAVAMINLMGDPDKELESYTSILLTKIDKTIHNPIKDTALASLSVKCMLTADSYRNKEYIAHDGAILCKLLIHHKKLGFTNRIYYELTSDMYEDINSVDALEWRLSEDINGEGDIYYRNILTFVPSNITEIQDKDEEYYEY